MFLTCLRHDRRRLRVQVDSLHLHTILPKRNERMIYDCVTHSYPF